MLAMKSVTDSMGTALERGLTHRSFHLEEEVGRFLLSIGYTTIFLIRPWEQGGRGSWCFSAVEWEPFDIIGPCGYLVLVVLVRPRIQPSFWFNFLTI